MQIIQRHTIITRQEIPDIDPSWTILETSIMFTTPVVSRLTKEQIAEGWQDDKIMHYVHDLYREASEANMGHGRIYRDNP